MIPIASGARTLGSYLWLRGMVAALVVLNALDGILTVAWIETGKATEANPLMNILIGTSPVLFMSIKMLLVCCGTFLLWRFREHSMAVASIFFCFMAYCSVLLYHLSVMNMILIPGW